MAKLRVKLEMEFDGRGNGWTDVSADLTVDPVQLQYGINGAGPNDRVATTGTLSFALNNSEHNSAGLVGYYSPNHSNRRASFKLGIGVRLGMTVDDGATWYYKFNGTLDTVQPVAGVFNEKITRCVAVDWMNDAARMNVTGLTVQTDKRSDELFEQLVALCPVQPRGIQVASGLDTYSYAFDNAEDEKISVLTELNRLAMSELGYVYVKGDTVEGGTLVFESRATRGTATPTNVDTFTDASMVGLSTTQTRNEVINKVQVITHPRTVDADPTSVLYKLVNPVAVGANSSITLMGPYKDPNQEEARIGGTSMVDPVPYTDYAMNQSSTGGGTDLTGNFTVVATYGGNGVRYTITNNGTVNGYITLLQARGKGVYDNRNTVLESQDDASRLEYGETTVTVDMPYQSDPAVGSEAAQYLVNLYKDPITQVQSAEFFAPATDVDLIGRLLRREISDRIGVAETVTGVTDDGPGDTEVGYFINQIAWTIDERNNVSVSWLLAPADKTAYWILEQVGASELDTTTILGYGLIVGHVDLAHSDGHQDVAHEDTAHEDTHGDAAHADAAHADYSHADVAHADTAHADTHGDTAHADTAHADTAHVNSHGDVAHSDVAHANTAHADTHGDVAHSDTHNDATTSHNDGPAHADTHADQHFDTAHTDTHSDTAHADSHTDVAHSDTHSDTAHSNVAHSNVAHSDAHTDTSHVDTHTDEGHGDAAHADTAHSDTHADTNHDDVAHVDDHQDTEHGDA